LYKSTINAAWFLNHIYRSIFSNTIFTIEEEVIWILFKKNTGFNRTTSQINNKFIKHMKFINYLLLTLEIIKKRKYDLYGDIKCRQCFKKNEDDNHIE
jgi:hypothetical protein